MSVISKRGQAIPMIIKIIKKRHVYSKCWKKKETPQEIKWVLWHSTVYANIQVVTKTYNLCERSAAVFFSFYSFPVIFNVFDVFRELVGDICGILVGVQTHMQTEKLSFIH